MNCLVSGGYTANPCGITEEENIDLQLRFKGICERGNYAIYHAEKGDFRVFVVKYNNCPIGRIFDDESEAIREFLKLTN